MPAEERDSTRKKKTPKIRYQGKRRGGELLSSKGRGERTGGVDKARVKRVCFSQRKGCPEKQE